MRATERQESLGITSPVTWSVLGLIIERPSYGYELGQRLERRFDTLLSASMPHIYGALDVLKQHKLIEPLRAKKAGGRQPKLHYRATAKGARAYREWLSAEMREDATRTELIRIWVSAYAVDVTAAQRLLDTYAEQCLAESGQIPLPSGDERSVDGRIELLLVEERRLALQAQLMWVDHAKKQLARWAQDA